MFVEFVEGPLWIGALAILSVGVAVRLLMVLRLGVRRDLAVPRRSGLPGALLGILRRFVPRREMWRAEMFHVVAGYMFHVGLFALLLFAAPHVKFLDERILGFAWTPMPHWAFIVAAQISFAGLLLLWLRRMLHPVMRQLSTLDDHLAAGLTFLAMFTGCLALFESFAVLRAIHLLSVELLMIYFPFSSLMHAFTFLFSRGFTGANYARHGIGA